MQQSSAALLWDDSFLWGVMALKSLRKAGLAFDLIRADEIKEGYLGRYSLLFVPGGWSSNKLKALGETGIEAVKSFVHDGGSYLGFCGGAGLATLDGIGLLKIRRKPTRDRIPSFSGRIRLNASDHPVFQHIDSPIFHAWWPPQFTIEDNSINVIASYMAPMPDAFSSDLNIGDVESRGNWAELEQIYQINLDPKRLLDDPVVVEGKYGSGRVLLSLVHFDTLDDKNGIQVMKNLWEYIGGQKQGHSSSFRQESIAHAIDGASSLPVITVLESAVSDIIDLGIRNFLWFWRNPMLLQWRRGVRGLEYCTLYIMIQGIAQRLNNRPAKMNRLIENDLTAISRRLVYFSERAKRLLVLERLALQSNHITYERCDNRAIQKIREELFSSSKSHGGLFKGIIDDIDVLLYMLIKEEQDNCLSLYATKKRPLGFQGPSNKT
ncbi:MAG: hypothetical protein HZB31_06495 [Nitrospirae bacterium]|nr:hypothetical protein [Nitrospirota bacterium]